MSIWERLGKSSSEKEKIPISNVRPPHLKEKEKNRYPSEHRVCWGFVLQKEVALSTQQQFQGQVNKILISEVRVNHYQTVGIKTLNPTQTGHSQKLQHTNCETSSIKLFAASINFHYH